MNTEGTGPALWGFITARRRVRVEALRAAVLDKVARTTLRRVAREIGLSAPGLTLFLKGSHPREATLRKIRDWYFSEASARADDVSPESAGAAVRLLVEGLPEATRRPVIRMMLETLLGAYRCQGTPPPAWFDSVWSEHAELPPGGADPQIGGSE